ncbi:MAG: hypothetical protein ABJC04_00570 [Verrucomicrobiota bacterium]
MQLIVTISSGSSLHDGKLMCDKCQNNADRNTRPNQTARNEIPPTLCRLFEPNAADASEQHRTEHAVASSVQPQWQITVVNHERVPAQSVWLALFKRGVSVFRERGLRAGVCRRAEPHLLVVKHKQRKESRHSGLPYLSIDQPQENRGEQKPKALKLLGKRNYCLLDEIKPYQRPTINQPIETVSACNLFPTVNTIPIIAFIEIRRII